MMFDYQYKTLKNGIRLAYVDEGQGQPLLLLHGFTGTAVTHFDTLITHLRDRYRVIAPDLRGYGRSQPPPRTFPPNFYQRDADDVANLIDQLTEVPVTLLGFSDGAETALLVAATYPHWVQNVVAWGVSGVISAAMVHAVQAWQDTTAWCQSHPDWCHEIIQQHGKAQLTPMLTGWVHAAEAIFATGGNICLKQAQNIQCPVWLINGDGEVGNTVEDVQTLGQQIPNATLTIVPQCGHAVHKDQPQALFKLLTQIMNT